MALLALGTWIVYALDRVLDVSNRSTAATVLLERHHFHGRHRRPLLWLCAAGVVGVGLLCLLVDRRLVEVYLLLSLPVSFYALSVHRGLLGRFQLSGKPLTGRAKEAAVAALFTAAVVAPVYLRGAPAFRVQLIAPATLLMLLCWFNCACISLAEDHDGRSLLSSQKRRQSGLGAAIDGEGAPGRRSLIMAAILLAFGCALYGLTGQTAAGTRLAGCLLLATLLLLGLVLGLGLLLGLIARPGKPRSTLRVRILADLALLTPLLLLSLLALH